MTDAGAPNPADSSLPPFNPARFERQLAISRLMQTLLVSMIVGGWLASMMTATTATPLPRMVMAAGLIGWLIAVVVSGRKARLALQAGQMIAGGAPLSHVEPLLADATKRFSLYRRVHVTLYHELAVLRHRQGRLDESAAICMALLRHNELRIAGPIRHRLLLLLADAALRRGDLSSVFHALTELHARRLELIELLQLLELQTRYEVACGRLHHALHDLARKVELAELMPAVSAAQVHAMLAHAAAGVGWTATSRWLTERAELLLPRATQSDEPDFVTTMPPGSLANPG